MIISHVYNIPLLRYNYDLPYAGFFELGSMFVAWNQDVFGDDFAVLYFSHPNSILVPKGSIQSINSC